MQKYVLKKAGERSSAFLGTTGVWKKQVQNYG
ncbi:hypothetical protein RUMOBE_03230 [Blautia obeum ATCC 29174]|uniref:Uncharacterized protein n=1 Tax=Blautia obeum ATCC 29174 TaxID=411459 RepID=A5ZW37_9FIRM|nr:hypothetical protein RUMOBE_03230 [Blautia obeum ATCC 29174]